MHLKYLLPQDSSGHKFNVVLLGYGYLSCSRRSHLESKNCTVWENVSYVHALCVWGIWTHAKLSGKQEAPSWRDGMPYSRHLQAIVKV